MNLMADSIAGSAVMDSDLAGDGLQVKVVVVILWAELGHVVIDVAYGEVGADAVEAHRFKKEHCGGACGVLGEGLVNADAYLGPGFEFALDEVLTENLVCKGIRHGFLSSAWSGRPCVLRSYWVVITVSRSSRGRNRLFIISVLHAGINCQGQ